MSVLAYGDKFAMHQTDCIRGRRKYFAPEAMHLRWLGMVDPSILVVSR